ncbi:amino acid ABC transporter permease [Bordetella bronchialis]|uniref:ABC transporter permease n=1 Tax=Bordetella bronchialis TaxID=463025 RepID=A0A193FVF6_9BORD|nr:amino acid ABC transporter permease [Bordetella bronchialis]ANN71166.1 ABC transporter permease [Bordetella bronchialis]
MHFDFAFLASGNYGATLLAGALTTVRLFAGAWVLGFAIALVLVALRAIPWRPLQAVVAGFVEYHRNVPTVVQIMVWYFGMPQLLPEGMRLWLNRGDTEFLFGLIALSLNVSGFMSEDIRAGLRAIPGTQLEAARSVGLGAWGALRYVMLPQAVRIAVPPLVNRSLILFKDTSLAMVIGVGELTYQVKAIENQTFRSFEVFAVSTALYLAASLALMGLGAWFGRRYPPAYRG